MIKVRRVYDPPDEDDGARSPVERLWRRGMKKEGLQRQADRRYAKSWISKGEQGSVDGCVVLCRGLLLHRFGARSGPGGYVAEGVMAT